jgi:hypothetical protein
MMRTDPPAICVTESDTPQCAAVGWSVPRCPNTFPTVLVVCVLAQSSGVRG